MVAATSYFNSSASAATASVVPRHPLLLHILSNRRANSTESNINKLQIPLSVKTDNLSKLGQTNCP